LHAHAAAILEHAAGVGLRVHVESDLLDISPATIAALVNHRVDVVSAFLPALTPATYAGVMGIDRYFDVLRSIGELLSARNQQGAGLPLVVPTFVKCRQN